MPLQFIFPAIVVILVSIIALLLHPLGFIGKGLWPPSPICPIPTDVQFPFFVFIAIIEAGTLGLGVAFLIWGYRFVRWLRYRWQRVCVFVALAWHLTNWALHDGLHMIAGIDMTQLLFIEYGFHVTLIAATCSIVVALAVEAQRRVA